MVGIFLVSWSIGYRDNGKVVVIGVAGIFLMISFKGAMFYDNTNTQDTVSCNTISSRGLYSTKTDTEREDNW